MNQSRPYVLIHGAGLGGWCWVRVRSLMSETGAQIFTPTLSGSDERSHLSGPIPGLDTHIDDVVGVIEAEDLQDVVLVGHSYAGMVITGVVDRIKSRIGRIVYLDAAVPSDGDDFASHVPEISETDAERRRGAFRKMSKDGLWLDPVAPELAGVTEPKDVDWVNRHSRPHPLRTWLDPIRLNNGGHEGVAKTYILATAPPTTVMGYPAHGEIARKSRDWTYREIACGHATMIVEPQRTAALLLEAGAREA